MIDDWTIPTLVRFGGREFTGGEGDWWIVQDGLTGWSEAPDPRFQLQPIPNQDGGFPVVEDYVNPRTVTVIGRCRVDTQSDGPGTVEPWVNGLTKRSDLVLEVADSARVLSSAVRCRQARARQLTPTIYDLMFVFEAADPRRYGPVSTVAAQPAGVGSADGLQFPLFTPGYLDFGAFEVSGGFYLANAGTADSWPVFRVRGSLGSGFTITSNGRVLKFEAEVPLGSEVVLSPFAGGRAVMGGVDVTHYLTGSDWAPVGPGETQLFSFAGLGAVGSTALCQVDMRDAWW